MIGENLFRNPFWKCRKVAIDLEQVSPAKSGFFGTRWNRSPAERKPNDDLIDGLRRDFEFYPHIGPTQGADSGVVTLTPVVWLYFDGPDIPKRPSPYSGEAAWSRWRTQYWDAIGVAAVDVPDEKHIAVRAIKSDRLLDEVIVDAVHCAESCGEFAPYEGGVVLQYRGEVLWSPDECDLAGGLDTWLDVVRGDPGDWVSVRNGMRIGMARVVDDSVELWLEQLVDGEQGPIMTVQLPLGPLAAAVEVAINERTEFCARLEERFRHLGWREARAVAATIAGVDG